MTQPNHWSDKYKLVDPPALPLPEEEPEFWTRVDNVEWQQMRTAFNGRCWLNDAVINTILEGLLAPGYLLLPHWVVVNYKIEDILGKSLEELGEWYRTVLNYGERYNQQMQNFLDRPDLRYVTALNIGNHHWVAVVCNLVSKMVTVYDSMDGRPATRGRAQYILDNPYLNQELSKLALAVAFIDNMHGVATVDESIINEWRIGTPPKGVPQQRNTFDCGVYTTIFLLEISRGNELGWIDGGVVGDARYYFVKVILSLARKKTNYFLRNNPDKDEKTILKLYQFPFTSRLYGRGRVRVARPPLEMEKHNTKADRVGRVTILDSPEKPSIDDTIAARTTRAGKRKRGVTKRSPYALRSQRSELEVLVLDGDEEVLDVNEDQKLPGIEKESEPPLEVVADLDEQMEEEDGQKPHGIEEDKGLGREVVPDVEEKMEKAQVVGDDTLAHGSTREKEQSRAIEKGTGNHDDEDVEVQEGHEVGGSEGAEVAVVIRPCNPSGRRAKTLEELPTGTPHLWCVFCGEFYRKLPKGLASKYRCDDPGGRLVSYVTNELACSKLRGEAAYKKMVVHMWACNVKQAERAGKEPVVRGEWPPFFRKALEGKALPWTEAEKNMIHPKLSNMGREGKIKSLQRIEVDKCALTCPHCRVAKEVDQNNLRRSEMEGMFAPMGSHLFVIDLDKTAGTTLRSTNAWRKMRLHVIGHVRKKYEGEGKLQGSALERELPMLYRQR